MQNQNIKIYCRLMANRLNFNLEMILMKDQKLKSGIKLAKNSETDIDC